MRQSALLALLLFGVLAACTNVFAQTTTYTIPTGSICQASGPEACIYYPPEIPGGRFQTGDPWTQLVVSSYNADYCFDWVTYTPTSTWTVADTPDLGSTAKLFTLDCPVQNLNRVPDGNLHAEIHAYSYLVHYRACSRSGCVNRTRTEWAVLEDSFVQITR